MTRAAFYVGLALGLAVALWPQSPPPVNRRGEWCVCEDSENVNTTVDTAGEVVWLNANQSRVWAVVVARDFDPPSITISY